MRATEGMVASLDEGRADAPRWGLAVRRRLRIPSAPADRGRLEEHPKGDG